MLRFASATSAFCGGITAVFLLVSQFRAMDYSTWLQYHYFFMLLSLVACGYVGFRSRSLKISILSGSLFYLIFCGVYLLTYVVSTTVLAGSVEWIPFFYKDYANHGFGSVKAYLEYGNNYAELLKVQVLAIAFSSFFYFCANVVGFTLRFLFN